jgi:hypothetical protein
MWEVKNLEIASTGCFCMSDTISQLLTGIAEKDDDAAQKFLDDYFQKMVRLARNYNNRVVFVVQVLSIFPIGLPASHCTNFSGHDAD